MPAYHRRCQNVPQYGSQKVVILEQAEALSLSSESDNMDIARLV
jgi:hypothetical protein